VLHTAAYYGDINLFKRFVEEFKKTQDRQERRLLIRSMTFFRDPEAIQAGFAALLQGEVPFIEGMPLLLAGQQYEGTRKLAFEFMKKNFDELASKRPTGGGDDSGAQFVLVGRSFCDPASRAELNTFFLPRVKQFVGAPRVLAQTLEGIDGCIANKAKQQPGVETFLRGF